jgi:sugar lactone lactonase YvrE
MTRLPRPTRALGAVLALAASTVACSSVPPSESTTTADTVEPTTTPTSTLAGPLADQTPPLGTFGLAFHGDQLWIADFYRGQVLAVDPDSGAIVRRLQSQDGVSPEVSDVAVSSAGTIFWLGYNDGAVAVLSNNEYKTFAQVTPGTYSIGLSADGTKLYAGGAVGHPNSLWTVDLSRQEAPKSAKDPATGEPATTVMRSFAVGHDGLLYAPRFGSATARPGTSGALVQVDPTTGASTELAGGLDGPIAVKLSADDSTAYVLSLPPGGRPSLSTFDLTTRPARPVRPPIELRTPLADNLAVADDGRIFVSSYDDSVVNVVGPDGQVKTLHIGQPTEPPS